MNMIKKSLLLLLLSIPLLAHAVGENYTQEKFNALNQEGKQTLVFIYATWCPTCKAQEKVLEELLPSKEFKGIKTLKVDYDDQKEVVRSFDARMQSTLIVFKGGKEVGRVVAETNRERIAALLRKTL